MPAGTTTPGSHTKARDVMPWWVPCGSFRPCGLRARHVAAWSHQPTSSLVGYTTAIHTHTAVDVRRWVGDQGVGAQWVPMARRQRLIYGRRAGHTHCVHVSLLLPRTYREYTGQLRALSPDPPGKLDPPGHRGTVSVTVSLSHPLSIYARHPTHRFDQGFLYDSSQMFQSQRAPTA